MKNKLMYNISYSFISNVVSALVSIIMVIFLPRYSSVYDYGLWQLYMFYFSYIGVLHLGFSDGFFLRYLGEHENELDRNRVSSQVLIAVVLSTLIGILIYNTVAVFCSDSQKVYLLGLMLLVVPIVHFKCICEFYLQAVNRIKDYSILSIIQSTVLTFLLLFIFCFDYTDFNFLWFVYSLSIFIGCIFLSYRCGYIVFVCNDNLRFKDLLGDFFYNIGIGSKLLLANISNSLIVGCIRYGISYGWSIAIFGKVSLTLSICNFLMTFINSTSIAIMPVIKNLDDADLAIFYKNARVLLSSFTLFLLIMYYPLYFALELWLPNYSDCLLYMSLLFPICVFESKVGLLSNSLLKITRKEDVIFKINLVVMVLSIFFTYLNVMIFHNLNYTVFSIVCLYALRCIMSEMYISNFLDIKLLNDIIIELAIIIIYMIMSWYFSLAKAAFMYLILILIYGCFEKNSIVNSTKYFLHN